MTATVLNPSSASALVLKSSRKKLTQLISELDSLFLERSELIKIMLTGYLSGTNIFIGGKPGTGKTMLSKAVAQAFGSSTFYYLMSATTQPDEILGAIDLAALQKGDFRRDLEGKLADCHLAILDEAFKANSPCLNTLLGLILDKEVVNGKQTVRVPLVSMIACSNELPQDDSLAPFWDRLPLRYWVEDVGRNSRMILMRREAGITPTPQITVQFTLADLQAFQAQAQATPVAQAALDGILEITDQLASEGIVPSTRKYVQLIDLLRAYAFVSGDDEVTEEHLSLLQHVLWNEPSQVPVIRKTANEVINRAMQGLQEILKSAEEVVSRLSLQDNKDVIRMRAFLGGADTKLLEMIREVDSISSHAQPGSKKHKLAATVKTQIETLRLRRVLQPQAEIDL